jgi:hypothetical protein
MYRLSANLRRKPPSSSADSHHSSRLTIPYRAS